ncbi:hypothetical protein Tco_0181226 [Tanacetum coccineum]
MEEYDLVNALKMYIHKSVIKKRVEDVQMGVESYQTKLNLTKQQLMEGYLHQFTPYIRMSYPRDIVYKGVEYRKRLMREIELHKFCDDSGLFIVHSRNRLGRLDHGLIEF